jgi:arsenate reductase
MITIYHNPRCQKSREGLQIVEESGKPFEVIEYLKYPMTAEELSEIIEKLGIEPNELIRKNESIWKENFKDQDTTMTPEILIQVMIENRKLIERPIVVNGDKAVIGRPPEKIKEII